MIITIVRIVVIFLFRAASLISCSALIFSISSSFNLASSLKTDVCSRQSDIQRH